MGSIAGAGLVSHAPIVMSPEPDRLAWNGGRDYTLSTGLRELRSTVFDTVEYDTVIVFDSHWATTLDTVVTSAPRRHGLFTSDEMPIAINRLPYDLTGDPGLAHAIAEAAGRQNLYVNAVEDPGLPIHYATLIPWTFLGRPDTPWISVSVCQTATVDDFLQIGAAIAAAVAAVDRKVLLVASGGLSHTFLPLRELRDKMGGDPANITTAAHRDADLERIEWMTAGDHAKVIDTMPEYAEFQPEAGFGHYLMLAGAIGGRAATATGRRYSEYESGIGTGQAHVWFEV